MADDEDESEGLTRTLSAILSYSGCDTLEQQMRKYRETLVQLPTYVLGEYSL